MVSTWRFWSAKEINLSRSHPFRLLLVLALVAYILFRFSNVTLFMVALVYMFSGIWARAAYGWQRRRRRRQQATLGHGAPAEPEPLGPKFSE